MGKKHGEVDESLSPKAGFVMRTFAVFLVVALVTIVGFALYRTPAATSMPSAGAPPISSVIAGHLVKADGTPFTFPAEAPASSLKYIAIFYSADWCPPCHTFTPVLAAWYRKFKPAHPDFELIFFSSDIDKAKWLAHMKSMAMPWPAFAFDDLDTSGRDLQKLAGPGVPDLVLVDANGKVLANTFTVLGMYRGPENVIPEIEKIVGPGR